MSHENAFPSSIELFNDAFGGRPMATGKAFGSVTLLGDHTEFVEGFVLPAVVPLATGVSIGLNETGELVGVSTSHDQHKTRGMDTSKDGSWTDIVLGCVHEVEKLGHEVGGLAVAAHSEAKIGVDFTEALAVATMKALKRAFDLKVDQIDIARMAQSAVNNFLGLNSGLTDYVSSSLGKEGQALFFDSRTMETSTVPVFEGHSFVVISSGIQSQSSENILAERFEACTRASDAFGVDALRDADMSMVLQLEGVDGKRARHMVRENEFVLDAARALEDTDADYFGELMTESHWSMSTDFETSIPLIDDMVRVCNDNGALGTRITGAGFGGCIVCLAKAGQEAKMLAAARAVNADSNLVAVVTA